MKRVFVSYSRKNEDIVVQLVGNLRSVGINTWYDQTLTGGQKWWDKIIAGIRDCDIFIFALSPESLDSEACQKELSYVGQLGKIVLPVLVADVNLNLLPSPLNEIQVTDFRRCDKDAALALVKSILTSPESPVLPDPLPEPPPVPISYVQTLAEKIASRETLSPEAQQMLLIELEEEFEKGTSTTEIYDLLLRFKKREDLLAKVDEKIDRLLENLGAPRRRDETPVPPVPRKQESEPGSCPQCRREVKTGSTFCAYCGYRAHGQTPGITPQMEGSRIQQYRCSQNKVSEILHSVEAWLRSEGFSVQTLNTENQGQLVQIKKGSGWGDVLGMSTALNILFRHSNNTLTVEIGGGKWADKAVAGVLGIFLLVPWITAGIGAWEQMKMPEKIFDYIGRLTAN